MSVIINNLILEITRRCNAKCAHCLRGDAQNINMSREIIDHILAGVSSIGLVQFSGGEPTLAVPVIRYFLKSVKARAIPVGNFFLYTNGKIASLPLVHALLDLYSYCDDPENLTGLKISDDQFHREVIKNTKRAEFLYKGLSFFEKKDSTHEMYPENIIYEGRAVENGYGQKDIDLSRCRIETNSQNGDLYIEGDLYINALGYVIPSCDLSYERQAEVQMGNVLSKTLAEIFKADDVNPKNLIEELSKKVA